MSKEKKPFYKRVSFWIVIIIILALVKACSGGSSATPATTADSKPSTTTEAKKDMPKMAKLNEEAKAGNLSYVVSEVKTATSYGDEYTKKTTEGQSVIIKVKVTNNDKEARTVDTNLFKLVDNKGTEFSADAVADMYLNKQSSFFLEKVNPNLSRSGYILFETGKDVKGLMLQCSDGVGLSGNGKTVSIDLGK